MAIVAGLASFWLLQEPFTSAGPLSGFPDTLLASIR